MNTPATSPSGAFHGMVLRTLQGEGPAELVPSRTLRPDQVALVGTRAVDPGEADYIACLPACRARGFTTIWSSEKGALLKR